jgi:hypothetical protein
MGVRRIGGRLLPGITGIAIALVGALLAVAADTSLPWLVGPLLAAAAARFLGVNCSALPGGRQAGQWRPLSRPGGLTGFGRARRLAPDQARVIE